MREIRLGRHPQNTTRVVLDLEGVERYSVFTLYNPYPGGHRLQARPATAVRPRRIRRRRRPRPGRSPAPTTATRRAGRRSRAAPPRAGPLPSPARVASRGGISAPGVPSANANGKFSLARQLGLGVARIVIDAGHGGHDPGAQGERLSEAELMLDVALRLEKLLEKQPGIEVVMTRDTDVFIPLEERTAIANREAADLFLSIHANASRNADGARRRDLLPELRHNPDAEAVAARENAASGRAMHSLPDIVRAIALNNKIDESRDFAETVQKSMVRAVAAATSSCGISASSRRRSSC